MARLADETRIANEYDFRHEFDGDLTGPTPNGRNAFTSVFWESSILSDEPYGDAAARSLGDRYLYVTDLALGRVVETPQEIADALDTYVDFDGTLDIDTATVLGYDFLADGSEAIADTLVDDLGENNVDRELASGPDPQSRRVTHGRRIARRRNCGRQRPTRSCRSTPTSTITGRCRRSATRWSTSTTT